MSTTHHTLGATVIPRGMIWVDEFDWHAVEKSLEYSTTGALLIDMGERLAGRTITLQGQEEAGWITRATLLALRAQAAIPGQSFALTLADGQTFTVQFSGSNPIEAAPVARPELPTGSHPYVATVRLIEV
ncbi:hypothetical protein [Polaromonas hydrogenivorans]|uniref:Uncharacterized protein n=1 Tax=Polaromonas hydrogenivorans TaxID=335476 RepID=A0AAU7LWD2_9BURK